MKEGERIQHFSLTWENKGQLTNNFGGKVKVNIFTCRIAVGYAKSIAEAKELDNYSQYVHTLN